MYVYASSTAAVHTALKSDEDPSLEPSGVTCGGFGAPDGTNITGCFVDSFESSSTLLAADCSEE